MTISDYHRYYKIFTWISKKDRIPDSSKAKLIEKNNKHYYETPQGHIYPSATTMLSATMPDYKKKKLQEWREREGEQRANEISKRATDIGTITHKLAEEYLNNFTINLEKNNNEDSNCNDDYDNYDCDYDCQITKAAKNHFNQLQPFLNKIDNVSETEVPLYHEELMFGGTADCIAEYGGVLSIIDFKTSKTEKYEEWIEDYFLQATLYSMMYHHITGIKISQIVILISGEEDGSAKEFVKKIDDYVDSLFRRIAEFNMREATKS